MSGNNIKRRFGDRYEGRRIRGFNPMDRVAWHIMPRRNGASNLLAYSVDVAAMEDYIRQKRSEGLDSFGITHVLLAAYVRTVSPRAQPRPFRPEALCPQRDMGQYGR